MVDPYRYRERFTMPRLLVIGTNGPSRPLDALSLDRDERPEPRRVVYLPNRGHSADDYPRLVGGLAALFGELVCPGVFLLSFHLSTQVGIVEAHREPR